MRGRRGGCSGADVETTVGLRDMFGCLTRMGIGPVD